MCSACSISGNSAAQIEEALGKRLIRVSGSANAEFLRDKSFFRTTVPQLYLELACYSMMVDFLGVRYMLVTTRAVNFSSDLFQRESVAFFVIPTDARKVEDIRDIVGSALRAGNRGEI
eukprot:TRINITY_DN11296_c0_g2_i2.p1 TRINITY_DN11296_c0_g2~~TRINITY_DN11296_c0_g2_i2.p1  ORF type:complete len:118 (-),score=29.32 TRINITY_DN11296_c0_g2_i2:9-362(-)